VISFKVASNTRFCFCLKKEEDTGNSSSSEWLYSDGKSSFRNLKSSDQWILLENGKQKALFKLLKYEGKDMLIKDTNSSLIYKLTSDRALYSSDNGKNYRTLGYGSWKKDQAKIENKGGIHSIVPAYPKYIAYKRFF
jgi:hypothetical protein